MKKIDIRREAEAKLMERLQELPPSECPDFKVVRGERNLHIFFRFHDTTGLTEADEMGYTIGDGDTEGIRRFYQILNLYYGKFLFHHTNYKLMYKEESTL